jgi:hypothetical protein
MRVLRVDLEEHFHGDGEDLGARFPGSGYVQNVEPPGHPADIGPEMEVSES